MENLVHSEIEWLRRGAKARTRKSKARIDKAGELISELAGLNARTRAASAQIDFAATDRKTKRLIELQDVTCEVGDRRLFEGLNFVVSAGMRVGVVGPNGSGKTTLLRMLRGEVAPTGGEIRRADWLRTVYFDQSRSLDLSLTLRRALAPEGDSVVYQDRVVHVASWAAKFLFSGEQLDQPVERLSGGERARVLIAQLMLQPADILLLDEPTNDLDIPTLEILEQSLLEFRGSLVLVTHDRYLSGSRIYGQYWVSMVKAVRKALRTMAMGNLAGERKRLANRESDQIAAGYRFLCSTGTGTQETLIPGSTRICRH